jgi:hypothetical protein
MSFLHTPFQLDLAKTFARAHEYLCILRDRMSGLRMDSELQQEMPLNLDIQRARSRNSWNSSARVHPVPAVRRSVEHPMTLSPRAAVPRYVERGRLPPHQTAAWHQNGLHY